LVRGEDAIGIYSLEAGTGKIACDVQLHFLISQSIDRVAAWDTIQDIRAQMDRMRYLSLHEVSPLALLIKQHAHIGFLVFLLPAAAWSTPLHGLAER